MIQAYILRVIYQNEDIDVFKDIAFDPFTSLEDVHQTILNAFGIEGSLEVVFSLCNENWERVEQYDLDAYLDMKINELIYKDGDRALYENIDTEWNFQIEFLNAYEVEQKLLQPTIVEEYGMLPDTAPSDIYDPESFLLANTGTKYKEERYQEEKEEEDDDYTPDIADFF
ncbi:MAG: hypothetical protein N4A45_08620 [Flavobacteriales bacterium]|jgi:hypothetical protein|nr:hypothetical protein [Flavobacteriales bacterium]